MFRSKKYIRFLLFVFIVLAISCVCNKNKKIDKLTLLVSDVQLNYKTFGKEEWLYFDQYLEKLNVDIEACAADLTDQDKSYIKKQISMYKKVKMKWNIENAIKF